MKKLLSLLLTGALTVGLLAGCGSTSGNAETPAGGEETTPVESNTPSETGTNLEGTVLKVGASPAPPRRDPGGGEGPAGPSRASPWRSWSSTTYIIPNTAGGER